MVDWLELKQACEYIYSNLIATGQLKVLPTLTKEEAVSARPYSYQNINDDDWFVIAKRAAAEWVNDQESGGIQCSSSVSKTNVSA